MATSTTVALRVCKRNNKIVKFNQKKLERAILNSARDIGHDINGNFNNLIASIINEAAVLATDGVIGSDKITDIVKRKLMDYQYHDIAEAYILFSAKQAASRLEPDNNIISDYIVRTRYSRYIETEHRRESFSESINRVKLMHLERYPQITKELEWAFDKVLAKEVLPSMRSVQFGGPAMTANHAKGYNCSFSVCNRPRFFAEAFWLLLSGTGTGFSVQYQHVDSLPEVKFIDTKDVKHIVIPDTIKGWADAANELIRSYMGTRRHVEFAYNQIRSQGSPLKLSGGKAPGHLPLKTSLENVRGVLNDAQGRQLKPIECFDIMCMLADAVYSGGIREAAMICLFSLDDGEMMNSKTGNWHMTHPWRARSNNSVVLKLGDVKKRQYDRIFKATKQWGEPGFYFTNDEDTGANPCVEIGLNPKLTITPELKMELTKWASNTSRKIPKLRPKQTFWGWQMCNLSEVNASTVKNEDDLYERTRAAAIIGTAQAGYTDFPYLGWVSEAICRRESLLGVSMTGIMDRPDIALDPEIQRNAAQIAVETNIEIAQKIGINSAARVTCVKPSGTASIVLGAVGSGIHAHHAKRYFRRVRANPDCPIYKYFKKHNPHMCSSINDRKDLITFPIKAPDSAITRRDLNAITFLEHVLSTQQNWVEPGTTKPNSSPGVHHNVSNTVTVKYDEWDSVREFIWAHRKYFCGISMLSDTGDKEYENAPREEVKSDADEAKWQSLIKQCVQIDWNKFNEDDDNTSLMSEKACAGGSCEI
jgi:ribonucleoside-triphosphate reductase